MKVGYALDPARWDGPNYDYADCAAEVNDLDAEERRLT